MKEYSNNSYDLSRFVTAQRSSYATALSEIRSGYKRSHWMWYIFPQISGLGRSSTAEHYAIRNLDEAKAYMKDDYLRSNLVEISRALLELPTNSAGAVFGWPDDMKLRSSMTLFSLTGVETPVFQGVLDKYFGGEADRATLDILGI